jgi:hypothetical protein
MTDATRRLYYATYNRASAGDHMARYYADKHKNYPPDIDRQAGRGVPLPGSSGRSTGPELGRAAGDAEVGHDGGDRRDGPLACRAGPTAPMPPRRERTAFRQLAGIDDEAAPPQAIVERLEAEGGSAGMRKVTMIGRLERVVPSRGTNPSADRNPLRSCPAFAE